MDFLFEPTESTDWGNLCQGDILRRTPELEDAIAQAHPYYRDAETYKYFIVLSQSCDLVRRSGKCKSRYITIAAMRPLSLLVGRLMDKHKFTLDFPIRLCSKDREIVIRQFLERLLHNTEGEYFFVRRDGHPAIPEDLCAFLRLSVSLRSDHYDACLKSKTAQLSDVFQAKLGWLTGNIYSRVGTPDIEEHVVDPEAYKNTFFEEALYSQSAWLTPSQLDRLKASLKTWKAENQGADINGDVALELLSKLPEDIVIMTERVIEKLVVERLLPNNEDARARAKNALLNDKPLQKILRGMTSA